MNEQPNQPQKTSGSKTMVTVIIIVVVVLAVLGIGGYFLSRYIAQKAASALIDPTTGGAVKTSGDDSASLKLGDTSVKTGVMATWPTDLPVALQAPEDVTIKAVSKDTSAQTWLMIVGDIPTNAIDNYIDDLVGKGWTKTSDDNIIVRIVILTKENWKLSISYDEPNRGAQLTVSPK